MRKSIAVLASGFLLAMLAACSGESGQATPATSGAPPAQGGGGQTLPHSGAPKVQDPLPPTVMDRDPCTALTATQIDELFKAPPEPEPSDSGVAKVCSWSDVKRHSSVGIQLLYAAREGLSSFYANRGNNEFFQVLDPVQGYPAIAYLPVDARDRGECAVVVGIADNMAFEADSKISDARVDDADPCQAARRVANMAVTTLKAGGN